MFDVIVVPGPGRCLDLHSYLLSDGTLPSGAKPALEGVVFSDWSHPVGFFPSSPTYRRGGRFPCCHWKLRELFRTDSQEELSGMVPRTWIFERTAISAFRVLIGEAP